MLGFGTNKMNTMIPAEMMGGSIQTIIYVFTAVAAFMSFLLTSRA